MTFGFGGEELFALIMLINNESHDTVHRVHITVLWIKDERLETVDFAAQ